MKFFKVALMLVLLTLMCFLGCGKVYATQVTVDLEQLSSNARNEVLNQKRAEKEREAPIEDRMVKWLEVGRGLGTAISEMGKALNMQVNDFAKTPVGVWAMIVLTWKLLAKELLGVLLVLFVYALLIISFRKFHTNERVANVIKGEEGLILNEIQYIPRYKFTSDEARTGSAMVHGILFVVLTIASFVALFA